MIANRKVFVWSESTSGRPLRLASRAGEDLEQNTKSSASHPHRNRYLTIHRIRLKFKMSYHSSSEEEAEVLNYLLRFYLNISCTKENAPKIVALQNSMRNISKRKPHITMMQKKYCVQYPEAGPRRALLSFRFCGRAYLAVSPPSQSSLRQT
jgi:hypothetical protein